MIQMADIREWRTHDVVDTRGRRIGELEAIYVDTSTDDRGHGHGRSSVPSPTDCSHLRHHAHAPLRPPPPSTMTRPTGELRWTVRAPSG
ncbi:hypothetical protein [Streptomyces sp. NBC_00250]|uniref:hypothetical protein n=1 Tax=Streptomyces sp. NBC_00250 TaxID=2903641 RepID=UPI003FA7462B